MTKLSSSILVLNLIQLWSCLFVDFYTVRVKPNPNRTTVPRGITHFLSSTCLCLYPPNSKYLFLSLSSIIPFIITFSSLFLSPLLFNSSRAATTMPYCDVGTQTSSTSTSSSAVAPADAHLNNDIKIFYRTYGRGPTKVLLIIGISSIHLSYLLNFEFR